MNRKDFLKAGLVMIGGIWVPKQQGATIIVRGPRVPGAAAPSYLYDENFEGTGTPTDWFMGGSADPDYATSPIAPDQSLYLPEASAGYATVPSGGWSPEKDELWLKFRFRPDTLPGSATQLFTMIDGGFNARGPIFMASDGTLTFDLSTYTTDAMSAATNYYVWYHYKKGASSTGAIEVWFNTTDSRPARGSSKYNGDDTFTVADSVLQIRLTTTTGRMDCVYDNFQVSEAELS